MLKSHTEWMAYCRGERKDLPPKPVDIPSAPNGVYGEQFDKGGGLGSWLGTGYRRGGWRSYEDAVDFVHKLNLRGMEGWEAYCRGERKDLPPKPNDIPAHPDRIYRGEFGKRGGLGAWLSTGPRRGNWRSYDEAVKFVHKLKLKSTNEWRAYCRGERKDLPTKPNDIPNSPEAIYGNEFREKGGVGAWLATHAVAFQLRTYQPYDDAVRFVHELKLKSTDEWRAYCRGERKDLPQRPNDIPTSPGRTYSDEFRKRGGWGAWLGTDTVAYKLKIFRTYDEAVRFVHTLKLKSSNEWQTYCRGERKDLPPKPNDIPWDPVWIYRAEFRERDGWSGWLGAVNAVSRLRRPKTYQAYVEAAKFVHALKLQSKRDWEAYCRGERNDLPPKPNDIPAGPSRIYWPEFRDKGGWGAWLGTGNVTRGVEHPGVKPIPPYQVE